MKTKRKKIRLNSRCPIGIFDSGLGGLTVFKEIKKLLPNENIIYFGDTARLPYGTKSPETIISFSKEITDYLTKRGSKLIIIACNTASSVAFEETAKFSKIPVIGIVKPSVEKAVLMKPKKLAVIGTEATISSHQYLKNLKRADKKITVSEKACAVFVPLIEEGWVSKKFTRMIIREYLNHFKKESFDAMILGCTHYPLLKKAIKKVMGDEIFIVDSAKALAEKARDNLCERGLKSDNKNSKYEFIVSSNPERFKTFSKKLLNISIKKIKLKKF